MKCGQQSRKMTPARFVDALEIAMLQQFRAAREK